MRVEILPRCAAALTAPCCAVLCSVLDPRCPAAASAGSGGAPGTWNKTHTRCAAQHPCAVCVRACGQSARLHALPACRCPRWQPACSACCTCCAGYHASAGQRDRPADVRNQQGNGGRPHRRPDRRCGEIEKGSGAAARQPPTSPVWSPPAPASPQERRRLAVALPLTPAVRTAWPPQQDPWRGHKLCAWPPCLPIILGRQSRAIRSTRCPPALQCNTLIAAGYETSSTALAFTIHLLASHPEAEAKLLAEVDAFGRDKVPFLPLPFGFYGPFNRAEILGGSGSGGGSGVSSGGGIAAAEGWAGGPGGFWTGMCSYRQRASGWHCRAAVRVPCRRQKKMFSFRQGLQPPLLRSWAGRQPEGG